jgi:phage tail protein X
MLMAANEEGGISGMGDIEQFLPEGIQINIPLPMTSANEGSTNTTNLAAANSTLLEMVSFALSI